MYIHTCFQKFYNIENVYEICTYTPVFKNFTTLKMYIKYAYLIYSLQKETLFDKKTKDINIQYIFSMLQHYKNRYAYMYISV